MNRLLFFLVIFLAAIFSDGFYKPDEHFQLLEFLNYKLGNIPKEEMAWEHVMEMRPWSQVLLYFIFYKIWAFLGGENPFYFSFLLRVFSGLFFFFCFSHLCKRFSYFSEKTFQGALLCWFIPFMCVRPCSEVFSSCLFILGMSLFFSSHRWPQFLSGLLFGLTFHTRFTSGFLVLGLGLYHFLVEFLFSQKKLKFLSLLGIFISLGLCILIDSWGYEKLTFTSYNYYFHNVVRNAASEFGVSPWYYYFTKIFGMGIPPLSLLYLTAFFAFLKMFPLSPLSFVCGFYFLVHVLIPHKEVRFLLTLLPFIPIFIVPTVLPFLKRFSALYKITLSLSLFITFITYLIPLRKQIKALKPIWDSPTSALYYYGPNNPISIGKTQGITDLTPYFYLPPKRRMESLPLPANQRMAKDFFLFTHSSMQESEIFTSLPDYSCQEKKTLLSPLYRQNLFKKPPKGILVFFCEKRT